MMDKIETPWEIFRYDYMTRFGQVIDHKHIITDEIETIFFFFVTDLVTSYYTKDVCYIKEQKMNYNGNQEVCWLQQFYSADQSVICTPLESDVKSWWKFVIALPTCPNNSINHPL